MPEMSLENDLRNMSPKKLKAMTSDDYRVLAERGAYPVMHAGEIIGFEDSDGVPLIMYK